MAMRIRRAAKPVGVEKPGGFFNEFGAPVPGARVEKPGRFFNTCAGVSRRLAGLIELPGKT